MTKDAQQLFALVGLSIEGNEEVYHRTAEILGEAMAQLSVAHAMKDISGRQYIDLYESQKESLIEELKRYKDSQTPPQSSRPMPTDLDYI